MKNKVRCAIYTRKSTQEGLDQDFNSLDAQREACAAYIQSQKHEGWVLLPQRYDDGGLSGGSLERDGLQRLLHDMDEGLVDRIVVYKIDRLTRSLADFAKLVERLDAADASFVSVTQAFNTATSMGRLTLNVLLSFAQFEREVTAERIRDKIAASKRKGLWMGGNPPLGYAPDGRTLKIVEDEAATVRTLFELYRQHGSVVAVKREADRMGLRSRPQPRPDKASASEEAHREDHGGGRLFGRGPLYYLLTNPVYAGRIRHHSTIHEGQHQAIIDPQTFDAVQAQLMQDAARKRGQLNGPPNKSVLAGRLFDETGDRLTPTHSKKKGQRYRYYISRRLIAGSDNGAKPDTCAWRLPAKQLEEQIGDAVMAHLQDHLAVDLLRDANADAISKIGTALQEASSADGGGKTIHGCIRRANLQPGELGITLDPDATSAFLDLSADALNADALAFTVPFQFRKRGVETRLVIGGAETRAIDTTLLRNIARAHRFYGLIKRGETFETICASENVSRHRMMQIIDLAFLAPDIVRAIALGDQPLRLTTKWLEKNPMPTDWQAQRAITEKLQT